MKSVSGQPLHAMSELAINEMFEAGRKIGWREGWKQGFFAALLCFALGAAFMWVALR